MINKNQMDLGIDGGDASIDLSHIGGIYPVNFEGYSNAMGSTPSQRAKCGNPPLFANTVKGKAWQRCAAASDATDAAQVASNAQKAQQVQANQQAQAQAAAQAAAEAATVVPSGYAKCADENGNCGFTNGASVIYGVGTQWSTPQVLNNGTPCNNSVFGDPAPNLNKHCYYLPTPPVTISGTGTTGIGLPPPQGAPTPPVVTVPPPGYTQCSAENGQCNFPGQASVAFGSGTTFNYQTLNNGTPCNNSVFGDPTPGIPKNCYYLPSATPAPVPTAPSANTPPPGYIPCANEGGTCSFPGEASVAYGAGTNYKYQTLNNGTPCSVSIFGDPAPGVAKSCYYLPQTPTAPTTALSPTGAPMPYQVAPPYDPTGGYGAQQPMGGYGGGSYGGGQSTPSPASTPAPTPTPAPTIDYSTKGSGGSDKLFGLPKKQAMIGIAVLAIGAVFLYMKVKQKNAAA